EARADEMAARSLRAPRPRGEPRRALVAPQAAPTTVVREMTGIAGQPLEAPVRREFEQRFGHDFSSVRVHTGARAAASARGWTRWRIRWDTTSCSGGMPTRHARPRG